MGLNRRLHLIVEQDQPFLPDVNEHESLAASGYRDRPLAVLLNDFTAQRDATVQWIRGLGDGLLERAGDHEFVGNVSGCDVAHHLAMHDLAHTAQIANLLEEPDSSQSPWDVSNDILGDVFAVVPGDFDGDGTVDAPDLTVLHAAGFAPTLPSCP